MTIKDIILAEIQNLDLKNGVYDTSLNSAKDLTTHQRRSILFELEEENKIAIKNLRQKYDADFPLLIIKTFRD